MEVNFFWGLGVEIDIQLLQLWYFKKNSFNIYCCFFFFLLLFLEECDMHLLTAMYLQQTGSRISL